MELKVWEPLEREYKPRLITLAKSLRRALIHKGFKCSPVWNWTDEDLSVSFGVNPQPEENSIDVTFRLCDAQAWDGEPNGTNFGLEVVEYGGRILGSLFPYNYTSRVWVDPTNAEAVAARWQEFEGGINAEVLAKSLRLAA